MIEICEKSLPYLREECKEAPGIPSVDTNLVGGSELRAPIGHLGA